jgi:hypothetical protein
VVLHLVSKKRGFFSIMFQNIFVYSVKNCTKRRCLHHLGVQGVRGTLNNPWQHCKNGEICSDLGKYGEICSISSLTLFANYV